MSLLFRLLLAFLAAAACNSATAGISCSVTYLTGTSVPFTRYDPISSSTGSLQLRLDCSVRPPGGGTATASMPLTGGSSKSCIGPTGRTMIQQGASPQATLGYNIYVGGSSVEWGNAGCGTVPTVTLKVTPGIQPTASSTQTLRGVIPANQYVPEGAYSDTLVLTIVFQ
jgi:spore coat protein U-like protein